jgi:hypothetical protein
VSLTSIHDSALLTVVCWWWRIFYRILHGAKVFDSSCTSLSIRIISTWYKLCFSWQGDDDFFIFNLKMIEMLWCAREELPLSVYCVPKLVLIFWYMWIGLCWFAVEEEKEEAQEEAPKHEAEVQVHSPRGRQAFLATWHKCGGMIPDVLGVRCKASRILPFKSLVMF